MGCQKCKKCNFSICWLLIMLPDISKWNFNKLKNYNVIFNFDDDTDYDDIDDDVDGNVYSKSISLNSEINEINEISDDDFY